MLRKVKQSDLSFYFLSNVTWLIDWANDVTFSYILVIEPLDFYFNVFAWFRIIYILFIRIKNLDYLKQFFLRQHLHSILYLNTSLFDFSCNKQPLVANFVNDWYAERSVAVSMHNT